MGRMPKSLRTRWAAGGAAVAVTLGAGGIATTSALVGSGERAIYQPIEPCRLLDTRPEFEPNQRTVPIGPEEYFDVGVRSAVGQCGDLFDGATGLALNVTAINQSTDTFLTLFPEDQAPDASSPPPNASHLNPTVATGSGVPVPNAVQVDLDDDGEFTVFNRFGSVDVIIDVVGLFEDHHHDDRYYTKSQADGRYYTRADVDAAIENVYEDATLAGKFLVIDPLTLPLQDFGERIDNAIRLPESPPLPGFRLTFTVPFDHVSGTPVLFRLLWRTLATSCDVRITMSEIVRARAGEVDVVATPTAHPFLLAAPTEAATYQEELLQIPDLPGGLLAGDAVKVRFTRTTAFASGDTCSSVFDLAGLSVIYG